MTAAVRCISKLVVKVTAPFRFLLIEATVLVLLEIIKFFTVLFMVFGIGYAIFFLRSILCDNDGTFRNPTTSTPRSDIERNQGGMSKYPYIVELPSKISAGSFR